MLRLLRRSGRAVVNTVLGTVLLLAGAIMLVTPGPGVLTIILGLAVLAREYTWAERLKRRLIDRIKDASVQARARLTARRALGSEVTELPRREQGSLDGRGTAERAG